MRKEYRWMDEERRGRGDLEEMDARKKAERMLVGGGNR